MAMENNKIITIKKGHHYSNEFFPKFICFSKSYYKRIQRTYIFDDSCRYDVGIDQSDKNKLFGWSYGFHQRNSVRVSWWYNPNIDKIELGLYSYINGQLIKQSCTVVPLNVEVTIYLSCEFVEGNNRWYYLTIWDEYEMVASIVSDLIDFTDMPKWGYLLTSYFGGNKRAPHKITLQYS